MNVTKRCKERLQGFLRNQGGQPADKDRRVVRVCGRELLAVWSDKIAQNRPRLCLMLP